MTTKQNCNYKVYEKTDGKTIRIEYRDKNGTIYKTTKTLPSQTLEELAFVGERTKWKKFGNAVNDSPDINTTTTKFDNEIKMQFISKLKGDGGVDKIIMDLVRKLDPVQSWFDKDKHRTSRYSDNDINGRYGETSMGKYVPPHKRPGNQIQSRNGFSNPSNDIRKQDEATICVSNLSEETQEIDVRDLFDHFGYISRVHLVRDKLSNLSKGVAFVTFNDKTDAQRAIDCVSGFGYDNLILHVEWATK